MSKGKDDLVIEHLGKIPLFAGCSKKQLNQLRGQLTETTVSSGRTLVKQGSTGYECFIIVDGHATVAVDDQVISRLGPGDYFGELALLDRKPRSATVTATTDLTVMVLSQREFSNSLDIVPGLALKLLENLALRLREANKRMVEH